MGFLRKGWPPGLDGDQSPNANQKVRRHFHGFRANCEQVPMLPAWAVRWIWDDPRHIPYLLAWKSRRGDKVKEAVPVMPVVPSPAARKRLRWWERRPMPAFSPF